MVASEPSPARKPGMSRTGRSSPRRTPPPRQTVLRRSCAASTPASPSRQNWGNGTPTSTFLPETGTPRYPPSTSTLAGMRAATIRDGRIEVVEHPDPEPQDGQLLVRVRAAGLNGADILQVAGHSPRRPGVPPDIPGLERAGEVVSSGRRAERFEPGDRVMGIVAGGGQAELAVIHERTAMPVPEELDWTAAGGVPEVFTTAHDALFTQAGLMVG